MILEACISADYPGKPGVLRDVSLSLAPGDVLGLAGQSGSGKSTIAQALLGLLPYRGGRMRGRVCIEGVDVSGFGERQWRGLRGNRIGFVPQSPLTSLNPALRIGAQLREAWRAHRNDAAAGDRRIRECLGAVSLPGDDTFLARRPGALSVGQAQRVLIAMAILHRPALLVADEPTSALDAITQAEVLELLAGLNRETGTSMLFVSHDLRAVAAFCRRVAILDSGSIVEEGPVERIFGDPLQPYTRRLVNAVFASDKMNSWRAHACGSAC